MYLGIKIAAPSSPRVEHLSGIDPWGVKRNSPALSMLRQNRATFGESGFNFAGIYDNYKITFKISAENF
jgi:hypothetical protein